MPEAAFWMRFVTPLGDALIATTDKGICCLTLRPDTPEAFFSHLAKHFTFTEQTHPHIEMAMTELQGYWDGTTTTFTVPLDLRGTSFQQNVWRALLEIPYGVTTTYGTLAKKLGDPHASQAIGTANGQNPVPIIVPCHRVIGANGHLVGYSGGLATKEFLLRHEGALLL